MARRRKKSEWHSEMHSESAHSDQLEYFNSFVCWLTIFFRLLDNNWHLCVPLNWWLIMFDCIQTCVTLSGIEVLFHILICIWPNWTDKRGNQETTTKKDSFFVSFNFYLPSNPCCSWCISAHQHHQFICMYAACFFSLSLLFFFCSHLPDTNTHSKKKILTSHALNAFDCFAFIQIFIIGHWYTFMSNTISHIHGAFVVVVWLFFFAGIPSKF